MAGTNWVVAQGYSTNGGGGGDNLGNHTATQDVNMAGKSVNACPQIGNVPNPISVNGVMSVRTNNVEIGVDTKVERDGTNESVILIVGNRDNTTNSSHAMIVAQTGGQSGGYPNIKLLVQGTNEVLIQEWTMLNYSAGEGEEKNALVFISDPADVTWLSVTTNGKAYFGGDVDIAGNLTIGGTNVVIGKTITNTIVEGLLESMTNTLIFINGSLTSWKKNGVEQ